MGKFMVAVARVLLLCAVLLVLPAIASAQVSVILQPDRGPVGTGVTAIGTGWPVGTEVLVYFENQVIGGPVIPDGQGAFTMTFCVPNRQPGLYPVFFTNGRENFAPSFTLTAGSPGNCQVQAPPRITLKSNQSSFQPGDTHTLTVIVTPGGSASPVDVYVALQLPDQSLFFYQSNGSFTTEAQPLVANWTVTPFSGEVFRYTFGGAEPTGTYTWYAAFTDPGTLNFIGDIANATFTFNPSPTQATPGWYKNSGPSKISEDSTWRVSWENSYIYPHPGTDNLYWYTQVEFRNVSSQIQNFQCNGVGCPSCIKEHITRGGTYLGYVTAEDTFCMRNPNFTAPVNPGEAFYDWVIFHNVPWRGDTVSLEWGSYGSSAWVDPWYAPYPTTETVPPAVCPPELVSLGTCQPTGKVDNQYWAGYAAYGAVGNPIKFAKVEASWIVPPITCSFLESSRSAYWVGLGGSCCGAPLEQVGIFGGCRAGIAQYWGIWQISADKAEGAQPINLFTYPVHANDHMEASVTDFGKGIYLLTLHNITREWTWSEFHTGSTKADAVQTAECIVEYPPGQTAEPFGNFGSFTFVGCKADNRSLLTYPRILQFNIKPGNTVRDELSVINSHSDFTVTWKPE